MGQFENEFFNLKTLLLFVSLQVVAISSLFAQDIFSDNFQKGLLAHHWVIKSGKWRVKKGQLMQYQDNTPNANIYKKIQQSGNLYYEYKVTFKSGSSAGIHIFASDITYEERGNSYLIWQDDEGVKIYSSTEEGGLGDVLAQNNNFVPKDGDSYTYRIWYSASKRRIMVVVDNVLLINSLIAFPLQSGKYISLRVRESVVAFDNLKIETFSQFPSAKEFQSPSVISASSTPNKITETELILRTDTIKSIADAEDFVNMMVKAKVTRLSLAFKDDETGEYFVPVPDAPYVEVMKGYEDGKIIQTILDGCHKNNIKVYAWIMTFRDPSLVKQRPDLVMMRKVGHKVVPNTSWVSPLYPAVQDRLMKIWKYILTHYDVDGVRIDHIRFDEDYEDYSELSKKMMKDKYGIDIMKLVPNTDDWIKWVDFRANVITDFVTRLTRMMREIKPDLELGLYALPFSVQYGSYHEWTGTGQDFAKLSKIPDLKIFVMAYWEDFTDEEGEDFVRNWLNDVIGNARKIAGDTIIPTFSVTDWASAWNKTLSPAEFEKYDRIARDVSLQYGYSFIAYFYYWKWTLDAMLKAGVDK